MIIRFSPGTPVSRTNTTDRHDITNIVESGIKHHNSLPKMIVVKIFDK
jgi:hypothetical protein